MDFGAGVRKLTLGALAISGFLLASGGAPSAAQRATTSSEASPFVGNAYELGFQQSVYLEKSEEGRMSFLVFLYDHRRRGNHP
jgi:hypothetical protein